MQFYNFYNSILLCACRSDFKFVVSHFIFGKIPWIKFFWKKITSTRHAFFILFSNLFSFPSFVQREILLSVGRHQQTFSWKNIVQLHGNYSITWLSKDYLFTANRRSFHTIISRCSWEKKENWKESLRSFFIKNPGKLNNRLCLATVSLDCISNDFVSLSHCAPANMAEQWSVVCVNFFPFHHMSFSSARRSIKDS